MTNDSQPGKAPNERAPEERAADLFALRAPFPDSAIGKLPKGGTTLDFVGHAFVTERLLDIDPFWTWEPMAVDGHGAPIFERDAQGRAIGMWIRLTVCGVTRIGYGYGPDPKQIVSDALRNAAMRFGVALDLWKRENTNDGASRHDNGRSNGSGHNRPPQGSARPQPPQNGPHRPNGQSANGQRDNGQPTREPTPMQQLTRWCANKRFCVSDDNKVYPRTVGDLLASLGFASEVNGDNLELAQQTILKHFTTNDNDSRKQSAQQLANSA